MRTLEANDVTVAYDDSGDGPSVVLAHGLGATRALWDPIAASLVRDHRVVSYDLRGSGESSAPPGSWTLEDLVDDLDALLEALALTPAVLVGHSLAGGVVLAHAARHPPKVRRVIGLGAVTELPNGGRKAMRQRAATVRADGMADVAVAVATAGTAPSWRESEPRPWDAFRATLAANDPESYARLAEIVAEIDLADELEHVGAPVLLVGGDLDAPSPPALNRANVERLAEARYVELPDCGHIAPLEKTDAVLEAMGSFLARDEVAARQG